MSTANVRIHHGEPPADRSAEQHIKDAQLFSLGIITSYAITTRDMLRVSGLCTNHDEKETIERLSGGILSFLEVKYQEVIDWPNVALSDNSTDTFFEQAKPKQPTERTQKRRVYFSTMKQRRRQRMDLSKRKAPQSAPGAVSLDDYEKK
jgi:hypothetical protein